MFSGAFITTFKQLHSQFLSGWMTNIFGRGFKERLRIRKTKTVLKHEGPPMDSERFKAARTQSNVFLKWVKTSESTKTQSSKEFLKD